MKLSKIARLVQLLSLLQGGAGRNVDALAQECGVSRRTIFRDLDTLRDGGVPVVYDEEQQRYHVPGNCVLPPTNFTAEEALSLLVLCHELGDDRRLPFYSPARRAAMKLEGSLPTRLRDQLRQITWAINVNMQPATPLDDQRPHYERLVDAIGTRRCVRIRYRSQAEGQEISTRLSPYRLLFSRHSWYCIGRSSLHREVRTFNLSRLEEVTPLDTAFTIPRGFTIDRYLRNAWHLIPEDGPDREVTIRFLPLVAQNVSEVVWHKTQQLEFNADGTLDFRVTVSGLWEISWWVLGYGDQAEVLEPQELRSMVAARARNLARRYEADA